MVGRLPHEQALAWALFDVIRMNLGIKGGFYMRVVQASSKKEQWILSTSDQPIVSKLTLSETPTFL